MADHRRRRGAPRRGAADLLPPAYDRGGAGAGPPAGDGPAGEARDDDPGRPVAPVGEPGSVEASADTAESGGPYAAEPDDPHGAGPDDPYAAEPDDPYGSGPDDPYAAGPGGLYADEPYGDRLPGGEVHAADAYAGDAYAGDAYGASPSADEQAYPQGGDGSPVVAPVYVDEDGYTADGTFVGPAVYVDEDGYAPDGTYVGPAVYVDEDGYAPDGSYVGPALDVDENGYAEDGTHVGLAGPGGVSYEDRVRSARRRRRRRHPILAAFVLVVVVFVLVAGGGLLWAVHQINPGGGAGHKVTVKISQGESTADIGRQLAKAGVIRGGATLFRYYVHLEGDGPLHPGTYRLATNETYDHAITQLETGPNPVTLVDKLVIPEGFTLHEIAARLAALPGLHLSASKFLALSSQGSVRSPYEPSGVNNLEGLVYPATYKINKGMSEQQILTFLVQTFDDHAASIGLRAAAAKLHMTPYQVITVASIIQGEAKYASDGARVASVINNRLSSGMPLGTDSTLVYALRQVHPNLNVAKVDYNQPNRYNTRIHKGLPPTPIDNPSTTFLQSAMHPAHTNLQYFVEINPDGKLGFASNSAGFARLTAECRAAHLC